MKKNWKVLLITSVLTLLPILAGVLLWKQLPAQMPSHWNAAGEIDGWSSKPFVVFGMPVIILAFHWICALATLADPKKDQHSGKVLQVVFWMMPILCIVLSTFAYAAALGKEVRMEMWMPVLMGLLLTVVGNYLPKCKQNYTIGIKIPWTLSSEENWNKTHRFAGRLWVVSGIAMILTGFFGGFWISFGIMLLMVLAPVIYSFVLYRKGIS